MKILYLANIRFPSDRAHATQIFNMCNGFASNGADTTLVVADRKTSIKDSIEDYYGQKQLFALHKIKTLELIHFGQFFFHLSSLFFALKALNQFKKSNNDFVYSREELLLYVMSFFINPKQLVWESHQAKFNFISRSLLRKGAKFVVISEGIRDYYIEKGVDSKKMLVAHDAVDSSFFTSLPKKEQARARLGLPESEKIIMYIGGFDKWKGIDLFLEASLKIPEFVFVVIGGSEEQIAVYKKKYLNVIFLGSRPYKDLKDHQQAADVLVIPNTAKIALSSQYTSPLKLFAHMTSKIPIVASRVPSITNVLSSEEAHFFDADDVQSLADSIRYAVINHQLSENKALKAFAISREYTWSARAKKICFFLGEMNDDKMIHS